MYLCVYKPPLCWSQGPSHPTLLQLSPVCPPHLYGQCFNALCLHVHLPLLDCKSLMAGTLPYLSWCFQHPAQSLAELAFNKYSLNEQGNKVMPTQLTSISIIYCCVTNYPPHQGPKTVSVSISVFLQVRHLVQGLSGGCTQCVSGCCRHLRLDVGQKLHLEARCHGCWLEASVPYHEGLSRRLFMAASFPQEWSREKDIESYHDALYDLISPLIVFVRSKSATLTERERISLGCEFWKLGIMRGHLGGQLPLLDAKKTMNSINSIKFLLCKRHCAGCYGYNSQWEVCLLPSQSLQSSREAGC